MDSNAPPPFIIPGVVVRLPVPIWLFAAGKVAFHLATTRLSHHRDELYFISASKRLAVSYVDFQPVAPALVWIERRIFGDSLLGLRLIPALAGVAVIILAALIARELGGNRRAQILAGLAGLIVPLFVGMDSALNTVSLETPAWMLVCLLFARLLRTGDNRWWVGVGAAIGLALLIKFTVVGYLIALGVAIIATPLRRDLRSKWLWMGAGVAVVMIAPSVIWQFQNGLPVLEFISNQGEGGAVLGLRGRAGYLISLIILPGFVTLLLYVPGLLYLMREKTYQALGVTHAGTLLVFLIASGKGYYAAPAIAVMICAGCVWIVQRRDRYPRGLLIAIGVITLTSLPLAVPLIPTSVLAKSSDLSDATEMGERIGWDDIARDVSRIYETRIRDADRADTIFLGENYTLPSAIEYYADDFNLPRVAVGGHNSSYLWWPDDIPRQHTAIVIGFDRWEVKELYDDVVRVGTVRNDEGVDNYEWGKPIWIGRLPNFPADEIRERVKTFEA